MPINETLVSKIEETLNRVVTLGGEKEQTRIITGLEVIDAAPSGLTNYVIIKDDRGEGTNILALKSPGVLYANGDLVSVIFIKGTEPVAFQQSTGSSGSPLAVSKLVSPDLLTDPVISVDNSGDTTAVGDLILSGTTKAVRGSGTNKPTLGTSTAAERWGNLYLAGGGEVDINGAMQVNWTSGEFVFNEDGNSVDFRVEGGFNQAMLFVDASEDRIGIGTTTPSNRLAFASGSDGTGIAFGGTAGNFQNIWAGYSAAGFHIGSGVMGDDSSTNILSSYSSAIGRSMIVLNGFTGTGGNIRFYTNPDATVTRGNTVTMNERMIIGDGGDVGIRGGGAVFTPSHTLELNDDDGAKTTTTTWTTTSDKRVKRNIKPYVNGTDFIISLPSPVSFQYNGYKGTPNRQNAVGFLAQDLQKIDDHNMIKSTEKGPKKGLLNFNPHELLFALVNSIKEIDARLNTLESA